MAEVKVTCKVCDNEKDSVCSIKKCKVKINKHRKCESFTFNLGKVHVKHAIPSQYIPWQWRDKNARKALLAAMEEEKRRQEAGVVAPPSYLDKGVMTKPDCLAGIRSSATVDDNEGTDLHV